MNKLEYVNNNCKLESLIIDMIDTILQYMSDNNLTYRKLAKLLCDSFGYSEKDINKKYLKELLAKQRDTAPDFHELFSIYVELGFNLKTDC